MLDDYKSLPFLAGISILFLIPLTVCSLIYYSLIENSDRSTEKIDKSQSSTDVSAGLGRESNLRVVPIPPSESRGSGDINSGGGIPIGKYSNPPTTIPTGGRGISTTNRDIQLDSSIDRNQAIQERNSRSTPDYSEPSASNNYNAPQDSSLAAPLEDDSFLELPESNSSEPAPISPTADSLFLPQN